jgi:hypothetical protein
VPIDSDPEDPDRTPGNHPASDNHPTPAGNPDVAGGPGAPDLRERQLAEHARYQHLVDSTYEAAARETWAKAAPELRATWEEHKQRHPERARPTPHTQPDGSWVGDGTRCLSPEQNAEASKACADLRDEAEQTILPAMHRIEATDPNRHLAGLEHMLKGEDRLKEKIADELFAKPGMTVREALDSVADAVRFTLEFPSERYAEGVLSDLGGLKSEGFELIKLKNLWHADQYKGVNSQWRVPETGTRFEMQFHTPESREAKELTHEAYERLRGSEATQAERRELKAFQRRVNALIMTPPGTGEIKDFPGKNSG